MITALLLAAGLSINTGHTPTGKEKMPEVGTVRVAVVNIGQVFNEYEMARKFKADLENTLKPYKDKAAQLTKKAKGWEEAVEKKDFRVASKEEYERKIIDAKRQLEDMSREIQAELGKKQEANLVTLWRNVQTAIRTHAQDNKIDLVLGFGDPVDKELLELFPNVNRKMQAMDQGSTVPLFLTSRADISDAVVELLNNGQQFKKIQPKVLD